MRERAEVVIVGAGIAGASIAYHLARSGLTDIVVLEREPIPGSHASGRNAALVRQNVENETNLLLAMESVRFFADPPSDLVPPPEFRRTGSLLLASDPADLSTIERERERARRHGLEARALGPAEAARRIPLLDPDAIAGGVLCPSDGVIDIHALLDAFLRSARFRGVRLLTSCRVEGIRVERGAVAGVVTDRGFFETPRVVNAAGAWAGALAASISISLPLRPTRRHLLVTEPLPSVGPDWPYGWDVSDPFYFRPESGGLLLSPCDEEDAPECDERTDPRVLERACAKAVRILPTLGSRGIAHAWAGLRTLTPDGGFAIGEDRRVGGFFWAAGLGGHGITCSPAVGRVAADLLLNGRTDVADARALSPDRFR